jgi:hypothetical protein
MSLLRKIQRNTERQETEAQEAELAVPENHLMLPAGKVLTAPIKGEFLSIPRLCWVSLRAKTQTPLVMLRLLVFKSLEDPQIRGTLEIELPVYEETEESTLAALERYGWDGRVWPRDEGWPTGSEFDEMMLKSDLEGAGLGASLVFPPSTDSGVAAQPVTVSRARGRFLMPPLNPPTRELDPIRLETFRALCKNPKLFLSSTSP